MMNIQWNRKRTNNSWGKDNNNLNQFSNNMSQYSNNWNQKSWHTSQPFKRGRSDFQSNQPRIPHRRNSSLSRWGNTSSKSFEMLRGGDNLDRSDFSNNFNGGQDNYRKKYDLNQDTENLMTSDANEETKNNSRPYLKWIKGILQEDPTLVFTKMQKRYWDKLEPKDDIRILYQENIKMAPISPYDGVTPRGAEGIVNAWRCTFCNVLLIDLESKKLHLMQKNHYLRYAKFCKKFAEKKLMKLELEKKAKEGKKKRKGSKVKQNEINQDVTENLKEECEEEVKVVNNTKNSKVKKTRGKIQEKKNKMPPKVDNLLTEAISIEELDYDSLE